MTSSFTGLFAFFTIITFTFSLPPSISLADPNSTSISDYVNQTFPGLAYHHGVRCMKNYGEDLSVASCHNAWQKIQRSSNSQRFISTERSSSASPHDVVLPVRYLSDDGICAIVRCPIFPHSFLTFRYNFAKPFNILPGHLISLKICEISRGVQKMNRRLKADTNPFNQDVALIPHTHLDEASGVMISDAAKRGLEECVNHYNLGGAVLSFSRFFLACRDEYHVQRTIDLLLNLLAY